MQKQLIKQGGSLKNGIQVKLKQHLIMCVIYTKARKYHGLNEKSYQRCYYMPDHFYPKVVTTSYKTRSNKLMAMTKLKHISIAKIIF